MRKMENLWSVPGVYSKQKNSSALNAKLVNAKLVNAKLVNAKLLDAGEGLRA